jgi:Holliday junction resolvase RusA-like endonuclease
VRLDITVPGIPQTQGSKRIGRSPQGKPIILDVKDAKLNGWRTAVSTLARHEARVTGWPERFNGPCKVSIVFYLPQPYSARRRQWPHCKPDLDKLVRAIFDALTKAGVWFDDSRCVELRAKKRYADAEFRRPGALIRIETEEAA